MNLVASLDLHGQKRANSLEQQKEISKTNKKLITLFKSDDLGVVAKDIFGINSKKSRKLLIQLCKRNFIFVTYFIYLLRKTYKTDHNKLFQIADNFLNSFEVGPANSHMEYLNLKSMKILKSLYSGQKIINWVNNIFEKSHEFTWLRNSLIDLKKLSKHPELIEELRKLPKSFTPKSFREFHNECSLVFAYLEIEDFDLEQPIEVLKLHGKNLGEYRIEVPQTKHDLVDLGNRFRFCIGTHDYYGDSIKQGSHCFIALFKRNKPVSGLFFNKERIVESYDYKNETTSMEVRDKVRELLFGSNEIIMNPKSNFARELRYDKEKMMLTIITKKGTSLVYQGVEQELVSEFENSSSHGRFYQRNIKGKYTYLKEAS